VTGDKKTLDDLWPAEESDEAPKFGGSRGDEEDVGPAEAEMRRLAKQLGIADLKAFQKLVGLVNENC
jgi:hypothetical protein